MCFLLLRNDCSQREMSPMGFLSLSLIKAQATGVLTTCVKTPLLGNFKAWTTVIWQKYCRYGVKYFIINQSIKTWSSVCLNSNGLILILGLIFANLHWKWWFPIDEWNILERYAKWKINNQSINHWRPALSTSVLWFLISLF